MARRTARQGCEDGVAPVEACVDGVTATALGREPPPLTERIVFATRTVAELERARRRRATAAAPRAHRLAERLALAYRLVRELDDGTFASVDEAAEAHDVASTVLRLTLQLVLLAPDIQQEILALPAARTTGLRERDVIRVAQALRWPRQRALWARLKESAGVGAAAAAVAPAARRRR